MVSELEEVVRNQALIKYQQVNVNVRPRHASKAYMVGTLTISYKLVLPPATPEFMTRCSFCLVRLQQTKQNQYDLGEHPMPRPVAVFHMRMLLSCEPDTMLFPSDEIATDITD